MTLPTFEGQLVRPGDPDYEAACLNWNGRFAIKPKLFAFCTRTTDVVYALALARQQNLPVRVRSGGHSYEAFSLVNNGVVIDLSRLNTVRSVNVQRQVAVVDAGIQLGALYAALSPFGVAVPGGSCPTVGLAGSALGGGYGVTSRLWGLTCDNVLDIEFVNAAGKIIHANAQTNADLFWACRGGGGGNFGIVTAFTLQVHPITALASAIDEARASEEEEATASNVSAPLSGTNQTLSALSSATAAGTCPEYFLPHTPPALQELVDPVSIYLLFWPLNQWKAAFRAWQSSAPTADRRLTSTFHVGVKGGGAVRSVGLFLGPSEAMLHAIAPLTAVCGARLHCGRVSFAHAILIMGGEVNWPGLERTFAAAGWTMPHGWRDRDQQNFKNTSHFAYKPLSDTALNKIEETLKKAPFKEGGNMEAPFLQCDSYGGAISDIAPSATAFVHRTPVFGLQYQAAWDKGEPAAQYIAWVDGFRKTMQPYCSGAYVNYCDLNLPNWAKAYYGANLTRLAKVKRKFDSTNLFKFPQSIPTTLAQTAALDQGSGEDSAETIAQENAE